MEIKLVENVEILDYEKQIGHKITIEEREEYVIESRLRRKFYGGFDGEILEDGILCGSCGNGDTIDEVLKDCCNIISGKRLVFNAFSKENREEYWVPQLVHTVDCDQRIVVLGKYDVVVTIPPTLKGDEFLAEKGQCDDDCLLCYDGISCVKNLSTELKISDEHSTIKPGKGCPRYEDTDG